MRRHNEPACRALPDASGRKSGVLRLAGSSQLYELGVGVVWPTSMRWPSGSRMYARISRPWSWLICSLSGWARCWRSWLPSLWLCRVGGRGGGRWLGAGEVGAADPDHGEVDDQGEQRDPGGDQEPAAEPGGEGMVVDRCGQRAARVHRVPGPRGGGGLGVAAVGDDGPGYG